MYSELGILILGLIIYFCYYTTRNFDYWKKRGVPYVKPIPLFGNLWDAVTFRKNAGDISADAYRNYPNEKVVGMFHFDRPALLIRDPELVYKIFVTDFHHFSNNGYIIHESVDPVLSRNVFFLTGEKWKRTRQMVSPALTVGKIKSLFNTMVTTAEKLIDFIEKYPEESEVRIAVLYKLKALCTRYLAELVATCGLGVDGHCFEKPLPEIVKVGRLMFEPSLMNGFIQLVVLMAPQISKFLRVKMVPKEVPEFFNKILRVVIEYRQSISNYTRQDLMQYWIDLKKKSIDVANGKIKSDIVREGMNDNDILNGCITFFIESYETTSMVTSFALYYLTMNKDIQDRVKCEVDQVYANGGGKLTFEAISKTPLMNNIILEVLRLHPALIHAFKSCTKKYIMNTGRSEPLIIDEDTLIVIPNKALSKDPLYWKDPEQFNPDRFDEIENDDKRRRGIFLPFGEGPRMCIGMKLGYVMAKIGLSSILKHFELVPTEKTVKRIVQDERHFISRNRTGLYVKFVKRA